MKTQAAILFLALTAGACSHHSRQDNPDRPGGNGNEPVPAVADYSAEKSDVSTRVKARGVELKAADEGVLYMTDGSEYTFVNLGDGVRVDFNPAGGKLRIHGVEQSVDAVRHFHSTATRDWWAIEMPADTAIIVTETL